MADQLTHFDDQGASRMVDVGDKPVTAAHGPGQRPGADGGGDAAARSVRQRPRGNVLEVARLAGIMAAKRTGELIPLCHPLPLDAVEIAFDFPDAQTVAISADGPRDRHGPAWRWRR